MAEVFDAPLFDDPEPDTPKLYVAAFPSACRACGQFIDEGDSLSMTDDGAICEDCTMGTGTHAALWFAAPLMRKWGSDGY